MPNVIGAASGSSGCRTSTRSSGPTRGSPRATSWTTTVPSRPSWCRTCGTGRSRCGATPTGASGRCSSRRTRRPTCPTGSRRSARSSRPATSATKPWIDFPLVDDELALLWMVNMGCIDMNAWYSRIDRPDRPDFVLFDLDPTPEVPWAQTIEVALILKELLDRSASTRSRRRPAARASTSSSRSTAARPTTTRATSPSWSPARSRARYPSSRRPSGRSRAARRPDRRESERSGQDHRLRLLGPAAPGAVSTPLAWGRRRGGRPGLVHDGRRARPCARRGDLHAGLPKSRQSLTQALARVG